jgi:hypothetical protein
MFGGAMSDTTLTWLVFSAPVEGMEDEYDAWYDQVHLHDVAAVPGVVSAQRFELGPERRSPDDDPSHRHLAVYTIEGDPHSVFDEITRRIESGEMVMSDALDRSAIVQSVWHPRGPEITDPR